MNTRVQLKKIGMSPEHLLTLNEAEEWNDMIIESVNQNFEYDFDQNGNIFSIRI